MKRRDFISKTVQAGALAGLPVSSLYAMVNENLEKSNTTQTTFDAIVLGVGSMGSSACYHLAKRGYSVLGIEQFTIPHTQGSHSGQSRIIRKAYFEHSDYVPLLQKAYDNWAALEEESGVQMYFKTGFVYFGRPDHLLLKGVRESSQKYNIELNEIDRTGISKNFPQFNIPEDYDCLIEPDAGFVTPERSILVHTEMALRHGASINTKEKVLEWTKEGGTFQVKTDKATYSCKKLVVTTGAWANMNLPSLKPKMKVTRQMIAWVIPKKWEDFTLSNFSCWTVADHTNQGLFYGFPTLETGKFGTPIGLKVGHHFRGAEYHPDHVNREVDREEEEILISFLNRFIPNAYKSTHVMKTCLYVNSPDENFIIDTLSEDEDVVIGVGFSGHGFKFAPVIGEILADLAFEGQSDLPIDFLSLNRFS